MSDGASCAVYPGRDPAKLARLALRLPKPNGLRTKCSCCRRNVRISQMRKAFGLYLCLACVAEWEEKDWGREGQTGDRLPVRVRDAALVYRRHNRKANLPRIGS